MYIREASNSDLNDVLLVERVAFGYDKEAELVGELLGDSSAKPNNANALGQQKASVLVIYSCGVKSRA